MPIIGLNSWSTIRDIFPYNKNWYKDFYISETEINQVPLKQYSNGIQIDVYDKFGNFIETLKSIKDVREKYKVTSSQIKNIQMGDKYLKDWIFKYHSKWYSLNNIVIYWLTYLQTKYIKRIPFAAVPVENGADGSEIAMVFPETYSQLE